MMNSLFLLISILFAAIGYYMGRNKGRAVEGLLLGLILGVIGLIILAFLRPRPAGYMGPRQWGGFGSFRRYGGGSYGPGSPYGPGASGPYGPYGQDPGGPYGQAPIDEGPSRYGRPAYGAEAPFGPPAWVPDPSGRFEYRWWDGQRFTEHVATGGVSYTDTPAS